ncbi:MAG: hypothetical protein QOG39_825 [Acidimicrobiaceae bacterium]
MDAGVALRSLLDAGRDVAVAAISTDGKLVALPQDVPIGNHRRFEGQLGMDFVVPADRVLIADAWGRALHEPVVDFQLRLLADPDRVATVHIFDVRAEHGVHAVVIEGHDPDMEIESSGPQTETQPVARAMKDGGSVFLDVDDATTELLGWTAQQLIGRSTVDFIHPDDVERGIEAWMEMRAGVGVGRVRSRLRHADGHYVWVEVTNTDRLDDPAFGCVVCEMIDISAEVAHLEALRDRERLLARLADALPIGICHLRADREVVYSNKPLVALLGPIDDVEALFVNVSGSDRCTLELAIERAFRGVSACVEVSVASGGQALRCELTFCAIEEDGTGVDGIIISAADVTDRNRLRAELEHRASHDALTGCVNRAATVAEIERLLRDGQAVTVAFVDLDDLKVVNDERGHAAGDELLRITADRLRGATRNDVVGRVGGDEFVAVCAHGDLPLDPDGLTNRIACALNGEVIFGAHHIALHASIGAASSLPHEVDAEALLQRADAAMYAVKRQSHGALNTVTERRAGSVPRW